LLLASDSQQAAIGDGVVTNMSWMAPADEEVTTNMVTMICFLLSAFCFLLMASRSGKNDVPRGIHKTTQPDVCSGGEGGLT
jgi:hypothetical protein